MSQNKDIYGSVYETVTRESAQNYRSFLHRQKKRFQSNNVKNIFSEETNPIRDHPHRDNKTGFS
jgi:hypothetical protein